MTTANHETAGGEWPDEVVAEALSYPCPFCGVQPPQNCQGDGLIEFTTPNGHVLKLHTPRLRQVPAYKA